MPNYKLYKDVYRERIRSVVEYITMPQTGLSCVVTSWQLKIIIISVTVLISYYIRIYIYIYTHTYKTASVV